MQFSTDAYPNAVDNITIKNDIQLFSEQANIRELEVYKLNEENIITFPKLDAILETAESILEKFISQSKIEDNKKKGNVKGNVESDNTTELLVSP